MARPTATDLVAHRSSGCAAYLGSYVLARPVGKPWLTSTSRRAHWCVTQRWWLAYADSPRVLFQGMFPRRRWRPNVGEPDSLDPSAQQAGKGKEDGGARFYLIRFSAQECVVRFVHARQIMAECSTRTRQKGTEDAAQILRPTPFRFRMPGGRGEGWQAGIDGGVPVWCG